MGKFLKNKKSIYQCCFCGHRGSSWPKMQEHLERVHTTEIAKVKGGMPKGVQAAVDMKLVRYHYTKKNKREIQRNKPVKTREAKDIPVRYKVQEIILPIYLRIPITLPSNVEIIQRPDDEENKE